MAKKTPTAPDATMRSAPRQKLSIKIRKLDKLETTSMRTMWYG